MSGRKWTPGLGQCRSPDPGLASVSRLKNRSCVTDRDCATRIHHHDIIEVCECAAVLGLPAYPSVSCPIHRTTVAHNHTEPAIGKMHRIEFHSRAGFLMTPRCPTIRRIQYGCGSPHHPPLIRIDHADPVQMRFGTACLRHPRRTAIGRGQYHAERPTRHPGLLVQKSHRIEGIRRPARLRSPRYSSVRCLQDQPGDADRVSHTRIDEGNTVEVSGCAARRRKPCSTAICRPENCAIETCRQPMIHIRIRHAEEMLQCAAWLSIPEGTAVGCPEDSPCPSPPPFRRSHS